MPLDVSKLTKALIDIDAAQAKTPAESAALWADAIVSFCSDMTYLVPGAGDLGRPALLAALLPGFLPVSVWPAFCASLEVALRAYWLIVATPVTVTIPSAVAVPSPIPLSPLLLPVPVIGIVSPVAAPPRAAIATAIYTWTITFTLVTAGPVVTPFI